MNNGLIITMLYINQVKVTSFPISNLNQQFSLWILPPARYSRKGITPLTMMSDPHLIPRLTPRVHNALGSKASPANEEHFAIKRIVSCRGGISPPRIARHNCPQHDQIQREGALHEVPHGLTENVQPAARHEVPFMSRHALQETFHVPLPEIEPPALHAIVEHPPEQGSHHLVLVLRPVQQRQMDRQSPYKRRERNKEGGGGGDGHRNRWAILGAHCGTSGSASLQGQKKGTRSSWCHSPRTAGNSSRANSAPPIAFQWYHMSGSKGGVPILVKRAREEP
jgi:hypothetical protein